MAWRSHRVVGRGAALTNVALASTAIAIFSIVPIALHAEARVTGNPRDLSVQIDETTLEEVLVTLSTSFALQYRSSVDLSRTVSGTYKGSLRQIVTRLLAGYDFFLRNSGDAVEIVVVGPLAGAATAIATAPARKRNESR